MSSRPPVRSVPCDTADAPCQFDLSTDFAEVIDGGETVTLRCSSNDGALPLAVVAPALRRRVTAREAAASGHRYALGDVVWHLPAAMLPVTPRLAEVIVDGSGRWWTILQLQLDTLQSRWRCVTRDMAIAAALDDVVAVLKATYTKDADGVAHADWRVCQTGLRAKIEPTAVAFKPDTAGAQSLAQCRIYIQSDFTFDETHRLQGPDGAVYKITAVQSPQRIGELRSIDAVRL
jgi:hypothetical protein